MDDTNMVILIDGINVDNEEDVRLIAGLAGYAGSVNRIDLSKATIVLGTDTQRRDAHINDAHVFHMMSEFVRLGFGLILTGS